MMEHLQMKKVEKRRVVERMRQGVKKKKKEKSSREHKDISEKYAKV